MKMVSPKTTATTSKLLHQRRGASSGASSSSGSNSSSPTSLTLTNLRQILMYVMVVYMIVILWYTIVTSSTTTLTITLTTPTTPFESATEALLHKNNRDKSMTSVTDGGTNQQHNQHKQHHNQQIPFECTFREYPPRRYYHIQKDTHTLDFLSSSDYIYGAVPLVLQSSSSSSVPTKLCVNQSEWNGGVVSSSSSTLPLEHKKPTIPIPRPFADGTNPSLLNLQRLLSNNNNNNNNHHHPNKNEQEDVYHYFQSLGTTFLGTVCMTDSQCSWKDTSTDIQKYHLSSQSKPSTVRTLLVALNDQGDTLLQLSLYLELDGPWGRHVKQAQYATTTTTTYQRELKGFDDARLFIHHGNELWITYRQGKDFGYDKQVLNRIHFDMVVPPPSDDNTDTSTTTTTTHPTYTAYVKASESFTLCCGRNMAMMDTSDGLSSLTWVDPVTVTKVPPPKGRQQDKKKKKTKESHFHGTNGYLIWLPSTNEYLGIGHFHRPSGRDTSDYARHGHHYTHAFFTISSSSSSDGSYQLSRLSQEFVFATMSPQFSSFPNNNHNHNNDVTDIIQFASGMELLDPQQDDDTGTLVMAYGINDCEAAFLPLQMKDVQQMLRKVPEGTQVVDVMKPFQ